MDEHTKKVLNWNLPSGVTQTKSQHFAIWVVSKYVKMDITLIWVHQDLSRPQYWFPRASLWPPTGCWLQTPEIYSFPILKTWSLNSRCHAAWFLLKGSNGESAPCFSPTFCWGPAFLGIPWHITVISASLSLGHHHPVAASSHGVLSTMCTSPFPIRQPVILD